MGVQLRWFLSIGVQLLQQANIFAFLFEELGAGKPQSRAIENER